MAVDSGSVSKHKDTATPVKKNENDTPPPAPPKRNKTPGVRMVGKRVYDPVNGKTCHQCRQKTTDFGAACKNQKREKACPIMYCHKCLLNRYGEKAEEVSSLGEWSCPRCRGICNCSICMKKRGHQPTGILTNMAKATGFASVSDMLLKGGDQLNCNKATVDKVTTSEKEVIVSPKKLGKENSFDGKVDANLSNSIDPKSKKLEERPEKRKTKQESFGVINDNKSIDVPEETRPSALEKEPKKMKLDGSTETNHDKELSKDASGHGRKKKTKKIRNDGLEEKNEHNNQDDSFVQRTSPRKSKASSEMSDQEARLNSGIDLDEKVNHSLHFTEEDPLETFENERISEEDSDMANDKGDLYQHSTQVQFTLPMGRELTSVAGIDVPAEDVGNALQFLEFCAAFGKVLDVKKRQPELVLQDLFHGRTGRQGKFSVTVQFHILLLSVIQNEGGEVHSTLSPSCGKNSWFNILKECLSESQSVLKAQLDALNKTADYETLDASQKLRLLNLLCDEVLGTEKVRTWMNAQHIEIAEEVKENRRKLTAARNEEKSLKQKMKDDIAQAIIAKHGAPLTISEHEAIVSHIKSEVAEAHAKVLESKGMLLKSEAQTCDAIRKEPVFMVSDGCVYWKLNVSGTPDIICQNVGKGDTTTLDEKWSEVDDEGQEALEKHICALRRKK